MSSVGASPLGSTQKFLLVAVGADIELLLLLPPELSSAELVVLSAPSPLALVEVDPSVL